VSHIGNLPIRIAVSLDLMTAAGGGKFPEPGPKGKEFAGMIA